MSENENGNTEADQYPDTPQGWAQRMKMEYDAAMKVIEPWHKQAERILRRYRDERTTDSEKRNASKRNYFTSNVQTMMALLYGKTPQVDVDRRFADFADDTARVAGEMLQRLLNTDITRDNDAYAISLEQCLFDLSVPGLGNARLCYVADFEEVEPEPDAINDEDDALGVPQDTQMAAPVDGEEQEPLEQKTNEDVEVVWVYWKDQWWSPARTFHEVRLWAFYAEMSREQLVKRFGEEIGKAVPLNAKRTNKGNSESADAMRADPWSRAAVWEIWDKEHKQVLWWVDGYPQVLDRKDDPLELAAFWPFPRPMFANLTTSELLPTPDYVLAQDIYEEIDAVSSRIALLVAAVRVVGLYDATNTELKRLLTEARANEMIPVQNWAMFAEKGGIDGAVSMFPLADVVAALDKLREYRIELVQTEQQITGMNDIMRGQASNDATATEQTLKARFSSVRVQKRQDELARFASDLQRIKAEIISKHFEPQTIIDRSNIMRTPDAQMAGQAVDLIKSSFSDYRVEVKPEAISMADFAEMKSERTEVMQALGLLLPQMMQAAQALPAALPSLLQLLQWYFSGIKGAKSMEGMLDQAIASVQQAAKQTAMQPKPPPPPDPKIVTAQMAQQIAQMKAQADAQHTKDELQADLIRNQAETQSKVALQVQAQQAKLQETLARERIGAGQ